MSAKRQREVLSPIVINSRASLTGVTCSPSTLLMEQQDDELERKARRRSRVMDLQRNKGMGSPGSPADRRKSLPLSGLSHVQLTDHYTSCIKLSAENKINSKNAFGLHLIDYMAELLQKKELENFQVASTTLDASAKIYAGRVDAIHAETYKVLSGLGRGADKRKQGEEGDDEAAPAEALEEGEGEAEGVRKKKKRTRKSKIIEKNLKNLDKPPGNTAFEVDPLFQAATAGFDEGGNRLSIVNFHTFDNAQMLALESDTLVAPTEDPDTSRLEERNDMVGFEDIVGEVMHVDEKLEGPDRMTTKKVYFFREDNHKNLTICPKFFSYTFTNWDSSEDSASQSQSQLELHRFDMDAEPEPIPDDNMSMMGGGDGSYVDELEDVADTVTDDLGTENCMGDGKAAQLVQSVLTDMSHGTTGSLMQVLAAEPSDYSYFNKMLTRVWAGPSHWRAGHLPPKGLTSITSKSKPKKKKSVFKIDFSEDIDFEKKLFKPSKLTFFSKEVLERWGEDPTTLPKDHHYEADTLFRLFGMKKRMIKRQESKVSGIDDELENYDYENRNDVENFCPNDEVDDDDDGDVGFGDFTAGPDLSQESTSSQDPFSQSQDIFTQPATLDGTIGGKLVSQPYKVAKIDINYAKTAKKLDVKRLKSSMWNMLKAAPKRADQPSTSTAADEAEGNQNNSATSSPGGATSSPGGAVGDLFTREMDGELTFQQMLNDLPEKVCGQTARNLSVPIAFVCLLHLANEKTLKIEDKDMEDLIISQGL